MKQLATGFALAALSASALCQESAQTLKLDYAGIPLRTVLQDVSSQLGVKLEAGKLGDRPIIASVSSMSAKTFFDRLAQLLDAEWTRSGDGFLLTREVSRERMAIAREAEARAVWLRQAIDKEIDPSSEKNDWSETAIDRRLKEDIKQREEIASRSQGQGFMQIRSSGASTPGSIVLNEALRKIPIKTFASVQPGERLVLATSPTKMQKALSYVPGTLDDYVRAYNRLVAANVASRGSGVSNIRTELSGIDKAIPGVGKVLVILSRVGEGLSVTAMVVGRDGSILERPQKWLAPPAALPGTAPLGAQGEIELGTPGKAVIDALLDQAASETRQTFQVRMIANGVGSMRLFNEAPTKAIPAETMKYLSDPASVDPQATFIADVFKGLAKSRKKDLLAVVPDYVFSPLMAKLRAGKIKVEDVYKNAPILGYVIEENEAIFVSSDNAARAERTQVNRAEFAKLVTSHLKRSYSTLDEICRYSLAMPDWLDSNLDAVWLKAVAPSVYQEYSRNINEFLKLYATLTPAQRNANQSRSMVPLMRLSTQQRDFIERLVYKDGGPMIMGQGQMITATVGGPGGRTPPEPALAQIEPTEAFPNGLPNNTVLTLQREATQGVFALDKQGKGRFLSAGDLGLRLGFNSPNVPAGTVVQNNFAKYQMASLVSIDMDIRYGGRNKSADNLIDATISNATALAYDELPGNFKQAVDRARQQAGNIRIGGPSRRTIPPR